MYRTPTCSILGQYRTNVEQKSDERTITHAHLAPTSAAAMPRRARYADRGKGARRSLHRVSDDAKACMTEKERVQVAIARIEAKRDQQTDPLCRWYYQMYLVGWEAHLKRLG